jgi:hypothetical protein
LRKNHRDTDLFALEFRHGVPQLTELPAAVGSPHAPMKDQQEAAPVVQQAARRPGLAGARVGKRKVGGSVPQTQC